MTRAGCQWWLKVLAVLVAVGALAFCGRGAVRRGLTYDELWTLNRYARSGTVAGIFAELATPNNHPLHSLLVRWVAGDPTAADWRARIPAWLAGAAVLAGMAALAWTLTRQVEVVFLAVAWAAASAPLLWFFQSARGYALQMAWVTGGALTLARARRDAGREPVWLLGAVVCALGAVFTLPTSVLFVGPLLVGDLMLRRAERRVLPAVWVLPVVAVVTGAWLWSVRPALLEAREMFGLPLEGVPSWTEFCGVTLGRLFVPAMLVLLVVGLWLPAWRREKLWLAGVLVVPLVLAPWTLGGPSRVYVAMVPLGLVLAAMGFVNLLSFLEGRLTSGGRLALVVVAGVVPLVQLPVNWREWREPDWPAQVRGAQDARVFVAYPAAAGYVIAHNLRDAAEFERCNRVPVDDEFALMVAGTGERLEGVNPWDTRSVIVELPATGWRERHELDGVTLSVFVAERLRGAVTTQGVWLAAIGPAPVAEVRATWQALCEREPVMEWAALNGLFNPAIIPLRLPVAMTGLLLAAPASAERAAALRQRMEEFAGRVRFYAVAEAPAEGEVPVMPKTRR